MNLIKKTITAMMLVLLAGIVTQSLDARFLGFGDDGDESFVHVGGSRGVGVGSVGVGGDEGLVHVGSSAYQRGRSDEANNRPQHTYVREWKQRDYNRGREDMRNEMNTRQEENEQTTPRRKRTRDTKEYYSSESGPKQVVR